MNALFQLISHEYRKYVFTRGFLLFLLIIPAAGAFGYFANRLQDNAAPIRAFTVIDETGQFSDIINDGLADDRRRRVVNAWDEYVIRAVPFGADGSFPLDYPLTPGVNNAKRRLDFEAAGGLEAAIAAAEPFLTEEPPEPPTIRERFVRVDLPDGAAAGSRESRLDALRPYLEGDKKLDGGDRTLFAAVYIPEGLFQGQPVEFHTKNLADNDLRFFISRVLTDAVKARAYQAAGVTSDAILLIEDTDVPVVAFKPDGEGEQAGLVDRVEIILPLVLAYALLLMITTVGSMLLTSTVEEKSNKIVEVLLSSVSASQLMVGKLVGLALVGVTVPAIMFSAGALWLEFFASDEFATAVKATLFGSELLPLFFFYFLMGYLLFASIYLAVGAMSNSIQDAQSFVGPLTILLLLPIPFLQMIIQDPNGVFARVFTWIPLYTPYAVMMRISSDPPQWEIIGATILLIVTVIFVVAKMGQIYRRGVLSAGGAPSWKGVRRLLKSEA